MQALILVGGEGTRLRPLTETLPKPAVPLCGRPLVARMIDWVARHGATEVILACGFRTDRLRAVLGDGERGGPALRYVEEPEPRGTAGAMKQAEELISGRFLALNGDVLADLDLTALIEHHERVGATATLGLYPVPDTSAYGDVRTGESDAVTAFVEKPSPEDAGPGEINAGAYVLEPEVLDRVPSGVECSIEREVFPGLIGDGLYAKRLEGYWIDVGTPQRFLQASWDVLEGRVQVEGGGGGGPLIADSAEVDPAAQIASRAVVGERCVIGARAEISESVLLDGCHVGEGAIVRGSILAPGSRVAPGARLEPGTVTAEAQEVQA